MCVILLHRLRPEQEKEKRGNTENRSSLSQLEPVAETTPLPLSSQIFGHGNKKLTTAATTQEHGHGPGSPE